MESSVEQSAAVEMFSQKNHKVTDKHQDSQTASDFINTQLQLEADAREVLPYAFDSCSQPLGPLRQTLFACTMCNPPPASSAQVYTPAGICYSCSIACHGDHTLVELFSRRDFVCDCGSVRMPATSLCTLRNDPDTGAKGVHSQEAHQGNHYNHNFQNRFCGCGEEYNVEQEKGTMFQCLGLGTVETGGCGEDWWHPECLMGLSRNWRMQKPAVDQPEAEHDSFLTPKAAEPDEDPPVPPGFPREDDFEAMLCFKCVDSNPWIKQYAGAAGFLPPLFKRDDPVTSGGASQCPKFDETGGTNAGNIPSSTESKKRKASDEYVLRPLTPIKRVKEDPEQRSPQKVLQADENKIAIPKHKHDLLPAAPKGTFSLFLKEDFRDHICHCPKCYPNLVPHPQLVEEEDIYQPPVSESGGSDAWPGSGPRSHGTGSLLERGEAALSSMDRVRAIEGVMVYNHLKDKVKDFLKPYAESGRVVGAEDIKAYFEKLRGDEAAIRVAGTKPRAGDEDKENDAGADQRREQSGY